ncbi:TetR/AcrR family transcriptional regulator [Roseicyclus persicicus]|uniref:TetR/AcrR family transcriptional regulator n=1 Tax=Roseicyclus persicicus TaxID=2650661 RepID=A0A7X6GZL7_9RHOB|nr:TetR/AcrR family transcriptional regulator [Roseibacterium persicicum]NKX44659.1 TetR/AcrR family transcriptional regulator [Roseibacterium persicicum]
MPRITPEAMEERRAKIIAAARRVFAAKGLSKVTLRDVFREAGLSAGAVYNYFQSKDDLILAVTEAGMAEALSAFGGGAGPAADLDAIIETFLDGLARMDPAEAPRVDLMIAAEALANPDVHRAVTGNRAAVRAALVALVERRQAGGRWTGLPAHALADLLYATYQGLILSVALGERPDIAGVRTALISMRFD